MGALPNSINMRDWLPISYGLLENFTPVQFTVIPNTTNVVYGMSGLDWEAMDAPTEQNWKSIAFGRDRFVLTNSDNNYVGIAITDINSSNTLNWDNSALPMSGSYNIIYGADKFIAFNEHSTYFHSVDGVVWETLTLPIEQEGNTGYMSYSNNKYIYHSYELLLSDDGINWEKGVLPSYGNTYWNSIIKGKDKYIAIGNQRYNTIIMNSIDGKIWEKVAEKTNPYKDMVYNSINNYYVAIGGIDTDIFMYSYNGKDWIETTLYGAGEVLKSLFFVYQPPTDGKKKEALMAFIYNESMSIEERWYTVNISDLIPDAPLEPDEPEEPIVVIHRVKAKMTFAPPPPISIEMFDLPVPAKTIFYSKNRFVTLPDASMGSSQVNTSAYSVNGKTWETGVVSTNVEWSGMAYGADTLIGVGLQATSGQYNHVARSIDNGATWIIGNMPIHYNGGSSQIVFGDNKFVSLGRNSGKVQYSLDAGLTWENAVMPHSGYWRAIAYGNGKFVAFERNTNFGAYSTDGITWKSMYVGISEEVWDVAWGGDKFIAIGSGDPNSVSAKDYSYSFDGVNWTYKSKGMPFGSVNARWKSIAYGNGRFVAIAKDSDMAAYTEDGLTWVETSLPIVSKWESVAYGDGRFVAVSSNSKKIVYSIDGYMWKLSTEP